MGILDLALYKGRKHNTESWVRKKHFHKGLRYHRIQFCLILMLKINLRSIGTWNRNVCFGEGD
jgi:hypothetical protein